MLETNGSGFTSSTDHEVLLLSSESHNLEESGALPDWTSFRRGPEATDVHLPNGVTVHTDHKDSRRNSVQLPDGTIVYQQDGRIRLPNGRTI